MTPQAPTHIVLPPNTLGRDLIVADIHGCLDALKQGLDDLNYDPTSDRVISVGDVPNGGPDSLGAFAFLEEIGAYGVIGNHERYLYNVLNVDGNFNDEFLKEDGPLHGPSKWLDDMTPADRAALRAKIGRTPYAIQIDMEAGLPVGVIHADIPFEQTWSEFLEKLKAGDETAIEYCIYKRARLNAGYQNGVIGLRALFTGHSVMLDGPSKLGNVIYLDMGIQHGRSLTIMDARTLPSEIKFSPRPYKPNGA